MRTILWTASVAAACCFTGRFSGRRAAALPRRRRWGTRLRAPAAEARQGVRRKAYGPSGESGKSGGPYVGEAGGSWGSRSQGAQGDSSRREDASGVGETPTSPRLRRRPREDESQSDEARPTTDADASGSYRSLRYQEKKASTKKAIERKPLPELEDEEPVPMSLADAKLNFETVVQIYLAQKSVDGILKVPAGTTGRLIPVKTGAVDSNSVAFSGQGRYTGLVTGTDLRSGRPVLLEATANMASTSWNVEEIRLLPGAAAPSAQTIRARSLYALAVRRHVRGIVAASKGVFSLKDDVLKKRWVLKLKRIHQNRLVSLGQGRYFTCVEFSETEGDEVVDADIYAAEGKDGWKVERTLIHAVDGVARFAYDENYKIVPVSKRK